MECSILNNSIQLSYAGPVIAGMLVMLIFRVSSHLSTREKRQYRQIQIITLLGAIGGAKLAVLMGDALWPLRPFENWTALLYSGRSIVGALLFGFLVSEMAKPLLRYSLPPNDRFAVALPFSIGIGRLACWATGCCRGLPHEGALSFVYEDGIARYPIAFYEMVFHFSAGLLLWQLYSRNILAGRLFAAYLLSYGAFRFASEYLRVTEKAFWGMSAYQWMALMMVGVGCITITLRSRRPPAHEFSRQGA